MVRQRLLKGKEMKCEACSEGHNGAYGSGRFCSSSCAHSFSTRVKRKEINAKVSQVLSGRTLSKEHRGRLGGRPRTKETRQKISATLIERSGDRKPNTACSICGKVLYRSPSRMSRYVYCGDCRSIGRKALSKRMHETRHKEYIKCWLAGKENGVVGGIATSKHIRNWLFEKHHNQCSRCGWHEVSPYTGNIPLEVEHIDGNFRNNRPENLDLICPNCHSLTKTYRGLNRGKGRPRKT